MADERTRVLEMVAEGRITPEQAAELLDALGEVAVSVPASRPQVHNPRSVQGSRTGQNIQELLEARMQGVDGAFIQEMRGVGFANLSLKQLMEFKMFGVDAAYIRSFEELGLTDIAPEKLCELHMHGVDAEFVRAMYDMGYTNLDVDHSAAPQLSPAANGESEPEYAAPVDLDR